jgi:Uma2 family endonuclease
MSLPSKVTEEQYLIIERAAEFRSEFLEGEMFAMSGGSTNHARLQQNLSGELYAALRGSPCEAFGSDFRTKVSSRMYTYPDVSVVCGEARVTGDDNLLNPVAIFEVLSPSTEKHDRGQKFQHYRTIDSLRDYILVHQDQVRIEQYTRRPDRTWTLRDYQTQEEHLKIDSIGVSIPSNGSTIASKSRRAKLPIGIPVASNPVSKLTEEQYLIIERAAEFRSEFLDGEIFAMSGGSTNHARLQTNILVEISIGLRGSPCEAFGSDFRIKVSSRMYTYPDVSVVCGEPRVTGDDNLLNPVAIFEVLSPSTEKHDRGLKFQQYRTIDSLKDYILVHQDQIRIEQYTRRPDRTWTLRDYQAQEEHLKIDSIGVSIPLDRIYDRIKIAPPTN